MRDSSDDSTLLRLRIIFWNRYQFWRRWNFHSRLSFGLPWLETFSVRRSMRWNRALPFMLTSSNSSVSNSGFDSEKFKLPSQLKSLNCFATWTSSSLMFNWSKANSASTTKMHNDSVQILFTSPPHCLVICHAIERLKVPTLLKSVLGWKIVHSM